MSNFYNHSHSHHHQYSNQSHSASSSSNSSPMERTQSNNSGSDSSSTPSENRNANLGFLEDFVHNNNYPGPSAQTMSQLFSNVASPNDYLPTNSSSRENRRTTFQQLPNLSLSGASDGTSLYKGLNNAFDWNDGTSSLAQSNRGGGGSSGSHGQGQLPLPPNREWQHPSNSSFSPDDLNNSRSNGWSNNYQRAQMEQQQQNWQASLNHQSLISSRQAQAEEEAIMAQAEEISKQFNSTTSKVQSQSSQNVKSEDRIFKPATSDTTRKPRARSTKPSASNQTVKKEEVEEHDLTKSTPESSSKVTNARKRKFTPATAPTVAETEVEDSSSGSGGRSRYPCLHTGCGKTFSTSGHRARHHRIHTGIKPYRCTFPNCGACFSRQDNGLQHFRTHKSSAKSTDQDEANDGGMSDSSRARMVETALEQGTAIEVVKGNQESRVEKRSQATVSPVKSTSKSRKTAHAPVPTSTSSKPTKAESNNASSRSSKRVKMEKTPSLDPSTESSASEASSSSSSGSRSTPHMRTTRRNVRALQQQKEGELPMLSVSLSSPSYSNPSSNGFSSSNGSSLSNGSSSSASTNASSTVVSPVFQQQDQREKQLQYSDSLRQQMMMMPIYGNNSMKDESSNEFVIPRTNIDSHNASMEGKVSAYDGMTPGTQDAARQTSFSDAFRGAFPQVSTPDIVRQQ